LSYERRACLDSVRRPGSLLAAVGPSPAMICCRVDVYLPEHHATTPVRVFAAYDGMIVDLP